MIIGNKYYLPSPEDDKEIIDHALTTMETQQKEILGRQRDDWDSQVEKFFHDTHHESQKISACEMFKVMSLVALFSPDFHFSWCPLHPDNKDSLDVLKDYAANDDIVVPEWVVMIKGEYEKKFLAEDCADKNLT